MGRPTKPPVTAATDGSSASSACDIRRLGCSCPAPHALAQGHWIAAHQNVLITGPTGVGKTYLACTLGHAACRQNYWVHYRTARLFGDSVGTKQLGGWTRWLRQLSRWEVLILDDWGAQPFTAEESHDLLEIMDDRYQLKATIIVSQIPWEQGHDLFPDPTVADALVDRIVHDAHRMTVQGESQRKVLSNVPGSSTTNYHAPCGD